MKSKSVSRRSVLAALPVGGAVMAGLVARPAEADYQPNMNAALKSLITAKVALEVAEKDKGGHRTKALVYTVKAIEEVERGIKYANTH